MDQNIKSHVLGVDISVRHTTYAIVDIQGDIVARDTFKTSDHPNVNDFVTTLSEKVVQLAESSIGYENIRSMGISAPSANYLTGCIENSPNLPWKGIVPLAAMLRDRLGISVALGNDAHVRALGEHAFGSAHGMKNFLIICLGHGIGSCIFSEGEAHLGTDGFAGEIGHTCVVRGGRECGCGRQGCLEAYCADKGIVATAKEMMAESDKPSLMRSLERLTPKTIVECCEQGDEMAIEVYRKTGAILGRIIANYASIIDPEAVIFTGGIANAGHWLFDTANEEFENHIVHTRKGKIRFLRSFINDRERDVLGASVLAWGIKEYSLFK